MALTPDGNKGKIIKLKRTSRAYNSSEVIAEQLVYGEPLYNDADKTLIIGDDAITPNNNLKVIKAVDRNKAQCQLFTSASGATTRTASGITNLYTESNDVLYPIDKNWGTVNINITGPTYNVDTSNADLIGTAQNTSFSSVPCVQRYTVANMKSEFVPTVSLYLSNSDVSDVSTVKAKNKAFSCISRVETNDGSISIVFNKEPSSNFTIQLIGG